MRRFISSVASFFALAALLLSPAPARANVPGGGTGTGANVTLTDGGSTVTLANGNVSIVITKATAQINTINYTYNGTTTQLLNGGYDGGKLYWSWNPGVEVEPSNCTYTIVTNPSANGGNYAEISLKYVWPGNITVNPAPWDLDIHYSLPRGTTGLYATAIASRPNTYPAFSNGDWRMVIYVGSTFNWFSVDAQRNFQMNDPNAASLPGDDAPKENYLWTSGIYTGLYDCKYDYSTDFGGATAWGWSSTTQNLGIWMTMPSMEYYDGGPLKRENNGQSGPCLLNVLSGQHYGQGSDFTWAANEAWTKTYGPFLIYFNRLPSGTPNANNLLFADAQAQGQTEQAAWPYSWFTNGNYTSPSGRGSVTGKIFVDDSGNPNASAAGLWVGVAQTPSSTTGVTNFEEWAKNYQYWTKTNATGNFTIPNVPAGTNYNLYAFGSGVTGIFERDNAANVTANTTTALGTVQWIPSGNAARVAPTVWEIGVPDHSSAEFRHGDDCWHGDFGPNSPNWAQFMNYPSEFPNGLSYTVGASKWSTDWGYSESTVYNPADGSYDGGTTWKIFFNLAQAPIGGAQASLYFAFAADFNGPIYAVVNNTNVTSPTTGFFPTNPGSDTMIRMGNQGAWGDYRLNFAASNLHQGQNEIDLVMRKGGVNSYGATWDYIRLELTGYVPPAPAGVAVYAGNNAVLLSWPVQPGATSYKILRSTTNGSGFTLLASTVTGPVCGSGPANATYVDPTAANGATYFYVVDSVNPTGTSANSTQSVGVAPDSGESTSVPAVPTGLTVTSVGNATVNLSWTTSPGANFYTVQRATSTGPYLTPEPYTTLSNTVTGTTFTDPTPTNGTPYYYTVTATNAVGASANSTAISATPVPSAPSFPPANLTVTPATGEILLSWSAAPNALGYLISRATSLNGTYILIASIIATSYADTGLTNSSTYYYEITAINAGGLSAGSTPVHTTTLTPGAPNAPGNLTAAAGPAISQITLNWDAVSGATSYTLSRSTDDNNFSPIATGLTATTYTDTGLSTGVTYYYVVQALNASGPSPYSASASSVPLAPIPPAPGNLTAIAGDGQVLLQWSPALGADTYNLSRTNSNSGGSGQSTITGLTGNTYLDTSVTNGVTYTYTVNATDASGTGPASAPASATPVQTFSQWIAAYFPGVTDPNIIGPNADPDGDGLTNLEEYFLGTDPAVPDAPGTLLTTATDNSGNLVITFRASKNLTGVTYKIQESTDMLNWTDTGVTPTVQSDQGAYDIMQASAPLGSNPRLFLKLSVSGP